MDQLQGVDVARSWSRREGRTRRQWRRHGAAVRARQAVDAKSVRATQEGERASRRARLRLEHEWRAMMMGCPVVIAVVVRLLLFYTVVVHFDLFPTMFPVLVLLFDFTPEETNVLNVVGYMIKMFCYNVK